MMEIRWFTFFKKKKLPYICAVELRTGPMKWPQRSVAAYAVTLPAGKGVSLNWRLLPLARKSTNENKKCGIINSHEISTSCSWINTISQNMAVD